MIEVVPATKVLLRRYNADVSITMRALCAVKDDEVVAIAGVAHVRGNDWLFMDSRFMSKRLFVLGIRKLMPLLAGRVTYAHADPNVTGSDFLLQRLGFQSMSGGDGNLYVRRAA